MEDAELTIDGETFACDSSMEDLLVALNRHGLKTTQHCCGHGRPGRAYISLDMRGIESATVTMIDGYPRLIIRYTDLGA